VGNDGDNQRQRGIDFGKSYLQFDTKFWWGIGLAIAVVVATVAANSNNVGNGVMAGLAAVAGALIGVLFAPAPKPADHSKTAHSSVERMMDMKSNLERARLVISDSISQVPGEHKLQLVAAQDIILGQDEYWARSVQDWDEVAPGVVERVVHTRNEGRRRLQQLAAEEE
jgi:hypothetical protein